MNIKKICLLALLAAILVGAKIALQAVPFVEVVTLLFAVYGLTLKYKECWIIFIIFWLSNVAINGFGLYWIPYIVFFPLTFTMTHAIKNRRHSFLISSLICINTGFMIFATYFLFDYILFGKAYAIAAGINAFWLNFLEGLINAAAMIIVGIPLAKVLIFIRKRLLYEENKTLKFTNVGKKKLFLVILGGATLFLGVVSVIPVLLFTPKDDETSINKTKLENERIAELNGNCVLQFKSATKKLEESFDNCEDYDTLGKAIDYLNNNSNWNISFIESRSTDFNGDGIIDRFIGGTTNTSKNFDASGQCPFIYVNGTTSLYGADTLSFEKNNIYLLDYTTGLC